MNLLVTGSSGLIGKALTSFLEGEGHQIRRLLRKASSNKDVTSWNPNNGSFETSAFDEIDAVVHLAGESIAEGRWTTAKKNRILESRVLGTQHLCDAISKLENPPKVLVSASAIGFYGDRDDNVLTESNGPGSGFLPEVCKAWEDATAIASERGVRVVHLRIGIILSTAGGALSKMLLPFKLGVGGVIGSGNQYMSWISLDDLLGVILYVLTNNSISGPVNAVAPQATTNRTFTKTLGKILRRPTLLPAPALALRIVLGKMADELLLSSTRVDPLVLRMSEFKFLYPDLEDALRHVLKKNEASKLCI
jgi:hypothetical protein